VQNRRSRRRRSALPAIVKFRPAPSRSRSRTPNFVLIVNLTLARSLRRFRSHYRTDAYSTGSPTRLKAHSRRWRTSSFFGERALFNACLARSGTSSPNLGLTAVDIQAGRGGARTSKSQRVRSAKLPPPPSARRLNCRSNAGRPAFQPRGVRRDRRAVRSGQGGSAGAIGLKGRGAPGNSAR